MSGLSASSTGGASPSTGSLSTASVDSSPHTMHGSVNSVLRVIIENMLYPITLDVLHQVGIL